MRLVTRRAALRMEQQRSCDGDWTAWSIRAKGWMECSVCGYLPRDWSERTTKNPAVCACCWKRNVIKEGGYPCECKACESALNEATHVTLKMIHTISEMGPPGLAVKTVKTVEATAETLDPEVAAAETMDPEVAAAKKEVTLETLHGEVVAAKNEVAELKLMIVQVLRKLRAMSSVTSSSHSDQSAFLKVDIPAPDDEDD